MLQKNPPSLLTTKLQSAGRSVIFASPAPSLGIPFLLMNMTFPFLFFFLLHNDIFFSHKSAAMSLNILMSFSDSLSYLLDRILLSSNLEMGSWSSAQVLFGCSVKDNGDVIIYTRSYFDIEGYLLYHVATLFLPQQWAQGDVQICCLNTWKLWVVINLSKSQTIPKPPPPKQESPGRSHSAKVLGMTYAGGGPRSEPQLHLGQQDQTLGEKISSGIQITRLGRLCTKLSWVLHFPPSVILWGILFWVFFYD